MDKSNEFSDFAISDFITKRLRRQEECREDSTRATGEYIQHGIHEGASQENKRIREN